MLQISVKVPNWLNELNFISQQHFDGPKQPILKFYDPKKFGNKNATRDFNSNWYNDHRWLEYLTEDKTTYM